MEQGIYQRPREKLRERGVHTLLTVELLQVIIGSGGPKASGAVLARLVGELFINETVSYQSLVAIDGIGDAKACQLLAVYELATRTNGLV